MIVLVTRYGLRYHQVGCGVLAATAWHATGQPGDVDAIPRSKARAEGLTPCRTCWPNGDGPRLLVVTSA